MNETTLPPLNSTDTDPLLAELRGLPGAPAVTAPDALTLPGATTAPPPPANDPLDVSRKPTVSPAIERANAQHSIKAGGRGFRVTVAGDYYVNAKEGKGKITKRYELSFNLPSLDGALSKIVGKLLLPALKTHYEGALGYRTHEVISAEPLTADTPPTNSLQFMDKERLGRYILENGIPINPAAYPDVQHLREACIDHRLNPKGFEEREARKQAERAETRELLEMNPEIKPEG